MDRRGGYLLGALTLVGALFAAAPASAATITYPTNSGVCSTTLQTCIDGVANGTTILIAKNTIDEELVTIHKSLTLKKASGFEARFTGNVTILTPASDMKVTLSRLEFDGRVFINTSQGSGHQVNVLGSTFSGAGETPILAQLNAPSNVRIEDNFIDGPQGSDNISITTNQPSGAVNLTIARNRVTNSSSAGHVGLWIAAGGGEGSEVNSLIDSNVFYRLAGCECGAHAGINLSAGGDVASTVVVQNNTIDNILGGEEGIQVFEPGGAAALILSVLNNSITDAFVPVRYPNANNQLSIYTDHNNFFGNDFDGAFGGYTPTSTNFSLNPQYVSPTTGDYRLQTGSPLRNLGTLEITPGLWDAARNGRIAQAKIDIGAYELSSTKSCTYSGTPGADILVGWASNDIMCGLGGNDVLLPGPGNDKLVGAAGKDRLFGGSGRDKLLGGDGADELDTRDGVKGNDSLNGGPGSDTCRSDSGDDRAACE